MTRESKGLREGKLQGNLKGHSHSLGSHRKIEVEIAQRVIMEIIKTTSEQSKNIERK